MLSKWIAPLLLISLFISCRKSDTASREGLLQNGTLNTGAYSASGMKAPDGTNWSELQMVSGDNVANAAVGFSCHYNSSDNYRIADDFTVPPSQEWTVSKISVYAIYDAYMNTAPFDGLHLQIWKGKPAQPGSKLVFGDPTANVLGEAVDSLLYAIPNSGFPTMVIPAPNRKIWKLTAYVRTVLSSGTYWLVWQAHAKSGQEVLSPAVRLKGQRGLTGWNAMGCTAANDWQGILDKGDATVTSSVQQDFPFEIVYSY